MIDRPAHDFRVPAAHEPSRIPALDGVRGLAILGVLLFKATEGYLPRTIGGKALCQLFGAGWAGVDLFFVLSGFLITGILLDSQRTRRQLVRFYARRTLRIFPLYFGFLALTFGFLVRVLPSDGEDVQRIVRNQGWAWAYLTNVMFVVKHAVFFDAGWLRLNHFWSLAIEEQFYLVWPLLVFITRRRTFIVATALLACGALAMRTGIYAMHLPRGAMFYPTPCRVDSLAIGALLAALVRGRSSSAVAGVSAESVRRVMPVARWGALATGAALIAVWSWRRRLDVNDIPMLTFGFTLTATFFACVLALTLGAPLGSWWRRTCQAGPLRSLGKYSYGMYVFHMLAIAALDAVMPIHRAVSICRFEVVGILVYAAAMVGGIYALAFISWHLYERHFINAQRFFR